MNELCNVHFIHLMWSGVLCINADIAFLVSWCSFL